MNDVEFVCPVLQPSYSISYLRILKGSGGPVDDLFASLNSIHSSFVDMGSNPKVTLNCYVRNLSIYLRGTLVVVYESMFVPEIIHDGPSGIFLHNEN